MSRATTLPLALLVLAGCAADDRLVLEGTGGPPASKIFGGSPADAPEHGAVVGLHQLARGGRAVYVTPFCSGTLIEDDVVLTAAHCLEVGGLSPSKLAIFVGDHASSDPASPDYIWDHLHRVDAYLAHADHDSQRLIDDIGIIRLQGGAATAEGVAPVPGLPAAQGFTAADVSAALNLNIAGFGVTETGSYGTRLQVDVPLGGLGCSVDGCPWAGDAATQISYAQGADSGPCSGDSGGPAFVDRGGTVYVGGLTSYGDTDCLVYGVSTRVDAYEGWIAAFVDPVVDTGGGGTGGCDLDGVCEAGESCDGRSGTTACADCAGRTTGRPTLRYCEVEGSCVGPGCP